MRSRPTPARALMTAAAVSAAALLANCGRTGQPKAGDTAAAEQAVRATEAQWNADAKAKDVDKFVAHYAPDAVAMLPGAPPMSGTQAIRDGVSQVFKDPASALQFEADKVAIAQAGDIAYTRGHFSETETDPKTSQPVTTTGSYVTIYRKQPDGSWKAVEDINSPTLPAGGAAASPK